MADARNGHNGERKWIRNIIAIRQQLVRGGMQPMRAVIIDQRKCVYIRRINTYVYD